MKLTAPHRSDRIRVLGGTKHVGKHGVVRKVEGSDVMVDFGDGHVELLRLANVGMTE
jgi:predicted metal-dependent RNase